PVQAADERALSAARRADDRGHLVLLDLERDVAERKPAVVAHGEVGDLEDRLVAHPGNVIRISRPWRLEAPAEPPQSTAVPRKPAGVAHGEVADLEDRLVAHPGNVIRISRPWRLEAST